MVLRKGEGRYVCAWVGVYARECVCERASCVSRISLAEEGSGSKAGTHAQTNTPHPSMRVSRFACPLLASILMRDDA